MQCKFFVALVAACLAVTVSAVPVGVADAAVARAPEPDRSALRLPREEEAREAKPGCTLYTCVWCVRSPFFRLYLDLRRRLCRDLLLPPDFPLQNHPFRSTNTHLEPLCSCLLPFIIISATWFGQYVVGLDVDVPCVDSVDSVLVVRCI
ncbi:hypothetical protein C8R46DRAFT_40908 [Mycena filopes]|nr:hypothetical protein C8R46DRAFT_40908 [Mycena filopes]